MSRHADADFVGVLSDLLSDIGTAVQEHEGLVFQAFGQDMLFKVSSNFHQVTLPIP